MIELTWHDLQFALIRAPKGLLRVMKEEEWAGNVFVGGGFLRAIVSGETISDIDVFTRDSAMADKLAVALVRQQIGNEATDDEVAKRIYRTPNALTLICFKPVIQIIHRWVFPPDPNVENFGKMSDGAKAVADSFDFTVCCAMFWRGHAEVRDNTGEDKPAWVWRSYVDQRFYADVAAKRLVYRRPTRVEDAGGSMLRVLKYYQRGYRIPLDSLGSVIARIAMAVDTETYGRRDEAQVAKVLTGLLREVDPNIDPSHVAHLPAENVKDVNVEESHET